MKTDTAISGIHRYVMLDGQVVLTQWTDLSERVDSLKAYALCAGAYRVDVHKDSRSSLGRFRIVAYLKEKS